MSYQEKGQGDDWFIPEATAWAYGIVWLMSVSEPVELNHAYTPLT